MAEVGVCLREARFELLLGHPQACTQFSVSQ